MQALTLDYVRNPLNLVLLVLVPAVFVLVAADTLAGAAELLGRGTETPVQTATAGWSAAFLAGLATYFQVATNRPADRRLLLAGLPARRLTAARLVTGLVTALAVAAVSVLALAARGDLTSPARIAAGTAMSALVYVGIGAVVAVLLPELLNGSIAMLFVWILDVFFGPVLNSSRAAGWRALPTHFVSTWATGLPSGHPGAAGDLGWALLGLTVWLGAGLLAVRSVAPHRRTARRHGSGRPARPADAAAGFGVDRHAVPVPRATAALGAGLRQLARTPPLWVLLVAVPAVFILLARATTPHTTTAIAVTDGGRTKSALFDLADIHGGTMAPIAVASLAMLAGLYQAADNRAADRRLVLAGYPWPALTAARCAAAMATAALAVAGSLLTAAVVFEARNWGAYAAGNALLAATFVLLGGIAGTFLGRLAGTFVAFLLPFLDVGLAQSPMLRDSPPEWARALPGYGASRVLLDGALTDTFDQVAGLAIAVGWLIALVTVAVAIGPRPARAAGAVADRARRS